MPPVSKGSACLIHPLTDDVVRARRLRDGVGQTRDRDAKLAGAPPDAGRGGLFAPMKKLFTVTSTPRFFFSFFSSLSYLRLMVVAVVWIDESIPGIPRARGDYLAFARHRAHSGSRTPRRRAGAARFVATYYTCPKERKKKRNSKRKKHVLM